MSGSFLSEPIVAEAVLVALGLLVSLWCSGLVLYAAASARRSMHLSLDNLAAAFGALLVVLGEGLRQKDKS